MTRKFPSEIFIGKTVMFYIEPMSPPLASRVIELDYNEGRVHVQPLGYGGAYTASPRAICDNDGHILDFQDHDFFFGANIRA